MVQKSHGPRHRSRNKMKARERISPNKFMQKFDVGDIVHIDFVPSIKGRGYPYLRFKGRTGRVLEKRGSAYVIGITDGNMSKKVIAKSVHLKKAAYR
ncbi:MAG: 50S ribosomal protein L21e [Candidatus Aenigmarchaeota archaeon]|nr:50S ribosomal protein L21e [Candidatus Aenigmarchaeota archaeon]